MICLSCLCPLFFKYVMCWRFAAPEEAEEKPKTLVKKVELEDFADFSKNSYSVTINRCQQLALAKAGGKLPTPAEQLELINKRREKKKSRVATAKPS